MKTSQELVTAMYESFYGLKEKPFTLLPDPDYLYLSPKHQRALTLLEYGMMNQAGFSVICGDTGAGKTTLIRRLLTELGDDTKVGLITNTHHSFGELLNWVLMAFGLDGDGKSKAQMHQIFIEFLIEQYAQNKHTVLIVDEAQNMSADTLEELRMLSNINADKDQVLQVILAGQPALRETLRRPELMQFAQRIAVDYYLESLSVEETQSYIEHRLSVAGAQHKIFTREACSAIYKYSGGTPRLINLLCDTALVYGFAEQSETISEQLVHDVVREQHSNSIIPTFNTDHSGAGETKVTEPAAVERAIEVQKKLSDEEAIRQDAAVSATDATEKQNNKETITSLSQQSIQQPAATVKNSTVSSARQTVSVKPSVDVTAVEKAQASVMNAATNQPAKNQDDSNVTPINTKQPDTAENAQKQQVEPESAATDITSTKTDEALIENTAETESIKMAADEKLSDANAKQAFTEQQQLDDDVYPIVHIEENPKKGLNVIVLALVGGMFVASIIMMVVAWMMFGGMDNNSSLTQQNVNQQSQREIENRELKALQKERDAALAVSRALERERDAALKAAQAQEEIRAAELRASEILAAQERAATKRLEQARARAREAEMAESKARERERRLKLKAERRETELEKQRIKLLREERKRLGALAAEEQRLKMLRRQQAAEKQSQAQKSTQAESVRAQSVQQEKPPGDIKIKPKDTKRETFSANPCNSPSAKFLSTCKK